MGYEIHIKESIEDKNSWFNIKRFKIGNIGFDRPQKSLDIKFVNRQVFDSITEEYSLKFCEATKVIRSYKIIDDLYNEDEDSKINKFFYKTNWLTGIDREEVSYDKK